MFNLEKEINKWKKSLRKSQALEDGYIEELESHLRDEIEKEIALGLSAEEAFIKAKTSLGNSEKLAGEYYKSDTKLISGRPPWHEPVWVPSLFYNYFKIAIRNFKRHFGYSMINVGGLAIGFAVCIFIMMYIKFELSYDKHFDDSERIHRVVKDFVFESGTVPDATTPPALGPAILREIPGVENAVRIFPTWGSKFLFKYGDEKFYEENVLRVDTNFFEIFSSIAISGNIESALNNQNAIILTKSSAQKYFGNEDPLNKIISTEFFGNKIDRVVTAVVKDVPSNTHFDYDFLIPMPSRIGEVWGWYNFYTYIKLNENISVKNIENKIIDLFKSNVTDFRNIVYTQNLEDIHLKSHLKWELGNNGDINHVYVFASIALLVIIIAAINYINLATAKSTNRAKEVGIRKVSGAFRFSLIKQFLTESITISLMSLILSLAIVFLLLPYFNILIEKKLSLFTDNVDLLLAMGALSVLIGFAAGIYPAIFLSSFSPVHILKGLKTSGNKLVWLRKGLVTLQFVITVTLIFGTIVITSQLNYIGNFDWGFDKEQVVVIPNADNLNNLDALKNELNKSPFVKSSGFSSGVLGGLNWTTTIRAREREDEIQINFQYVDYDFFNTLGIKIIEGRAFSREFPSDTLNSVILSELAVKELGLSKPWVGKDFILSENQDTTIYGRIIGVAKDFHFTSLKLANKPFAFLMNDDQLSNLFVKIDTKDYNNAISYVGNTWNAFLPDRPFEYYFLDNNLDRLHKADLKFKDVFSIMTMIAIFIGCLGLFALTAFTVEKRTKEIGVRKVLGASAISIVKLLSTELLKTVIAAALIALPLGFYVMNNWLQNFAYKTEISINAFALSITAAVLIALFTISYLAVKASLANPIKSIKYE